MEASHFHSFECSKHSHSLSSWSLFAVITSSNAAAIHNKMPKSLQCTVKWGSVQEYALAVLIQPLFIHPWIVGLIYFIYHVINIQNELIFSLSHPPLFSLINALIFLLDGAASCLDCGGLFFNCFRGKLEAQVVELNLEPRIEKLWKWEMFNRFGEAAGGGGMKLTKSSRKENKYPKT